MRPPPPPPTPPPAPPIPRMPAVVSEAAQSRQTHPPDLAAASRSPHIAAMLACACIALVCGSCGQRPSAEDPASHHDQAQKNTPTESEIAAEVVRFWKAGQHDESRRKAQQGLDLFGSKDSYARWQFTLYRDLGPEQGDKALLTLPLPA